MTERGLRQPWDREPPVRLVGETIRQVHAGASMNQHGTDDVVAVEWTDVDALLESMASELLWHRTHSPPWPWHPEAP